MKLKMEVRDGHKLYILCVRNTAYYLIGPFADYDETSKWGDMEELETGDPRWQTIELEDKPGNLLPMLRGPDAHIPSEPTE